jgi:hypothetical protein
MLPVVPAPPAPIVIVYTVPGETVTRAMQTPPYPPVPNCSLYELTTPPEPPPTQVTKILVTPAGQVQVVEEPVIKT